MLAASTDDCLILADGTKIDPSGKVVREKKERFVEIPNASQAVAIVAKSRRSVAELPLPPAKMNAVSLVLFYTMWGLGEADVALAIGISREQVANIQKLEQYKQMSSDIQAAVLAHEGNEVRDIFTRHAKTAAMKVIDIVENADEDSVLGFKAAQDILDRAGHRPADVVMHKHGLDDSLKVLYIKSEAPESLPDTNIIDADFEEVK